MKQGLIGRKLTHSYSKLIHQEFYRITQKENSYELFEIEHEEDIEAFLKKCRNNGTHHLNVTIPYKKEVMKYMDSLSEDAKKIDAVNTIKITDNKFHGYNSDYFGFIKTLEKVNMNVIQSKWIVLGNGGSSKSVIAALKDLGCEQLKVVSRTQKGEGYLSYEELNEIEGYDGVVNTTPVGMFPNAGESVISEAVIRKFRYAIDLIYNPEITVFLSLAIKNNLSYANGLYMLVAQAIKSQEIWNDETYEETVIEEIYRKMVKEL
ncbi:MAG: shikimate dehydrogenase [Clostridia bacterium]|nr:shikimate dehydrogenase [Clostridia bacterium]